MRRASSSATSIAAAPAQNSAACRSAGRMPLEVEIDELGDTARSVDHGQEGNQHRQRAQHAPGARLSDIRDRARHDARPEPADELLRIRQYPAYREQRGHPDYLPR